jgi:rSAM/selenodomain-associated transferase 1
MEDTLRRFAQLPVTRMVVYAPADAAEFFARLAEGRYELLPQAAGDLGDRQQRFFESARGLGFSRIVCVGADSPTLPIEYVERAFALLDSKDLVIGPALDGGYYLIGCESATLPAFDAIPWSTARVLEETLNRAKGLRLGLLPPWYDVDTLDDWHLLRGHIKAMRAAGIDPGVPCVERLCEETANP